MVQSERLLALATWQADLVGNYGHVATAAMGLRLSPWAGYTRRAAATRMLEAGAVKSR